VTGILTLGRYLIWLAVFLFFYSSFMVLLQFGSKSYVPKMVEGWGSIAQELEASYKTLSATTATSTAPAGEGQPAASGEAKTGAAGEAQKSGELPGHVALLIWGSVVVCLLGFFWMVALAFQEGMLWGLGVLFIPFLGLIFWLTHFREATPPLVIWAIGAVVQFFVFSHYGIDFQEYFLGSPAPIPPPKSDPLEVPGMIIPVLMSFFS
jgi:hypothetical protein